MRIPRSSLALVRGSILFNHDNAPLDPGGDRTDRALVLNLGCAI